MPKAFGTRHLAIAESELYTEEAYAWRLPSMVPLINFILLICLFALLLSLLFLFVTTKKIFATVFTTFFILIIILVTLTVILNHYFPNPSSKFCCCWSFRIFMLFVCILCKFLWLYCLVNSPIAFITWLLIDFQSLII